MRLHRFYVTQPLGEEVVVNDVSKIKQWKKVFRYRPRDLVILFNGDGVDKEYEIVSLSTSECKLKLLRTKDTYLPPVAINLFVSIIKKDLFELVVQKGTELGVTTIIPITPLRSLEKNLRFERLETIAIEASEQCGRGDIPKIVETITLTQAMQNIEKNSLTICLEKNGDAYQDVLHTTKRNETTTINIFVGPEGGWSNDELELLKEHGAVKMSLGSTVLRTETAAIVAVALCTTF